VPLGPALRIRREAAGLSQSRLARQLGIDVATVSRWERDQRKPAFDLLAPLADALGCTVDDLARAAESVA